MPHQEVNLHKGADESGHRVDTDKVAAVERKLRHFRGISATILREALDVFAEISEDCSDKRTPEDVLEGKPEPVSELPTCGWDDLRRKLHLLKHYLDYAKKLCDGSISGEHHE